MPDPQKAIQSLLDRKVATGEEIGLQASAYRHGELIVNAVAGTMESGTDRQVDEDSLFCIFSCSKGITTTALHIAADQGVLSYDDPIAQHWPEFGQYGKAEITIRQALCHTAGLPDLPMGVDVADWEAMCWAITLLEPQWKPGTETGYSGLTFGWLIGEVLHRAWGRSLAEIATEEICAPIGISDLYYGVPESQIHRVATLQNHPGMLEGPAATYATRVFAPLFNTDPIRRASIPAGGVITNARSLARMYAALIGTGVDGVRLLSSKRMAIATTLQTQEVDRVLGAPYAKSLGYLLGQPGSSLSARGTAFGHTGFGGSLGFADPECGLSFALTKNHLVPPGPSSPGVAHEAAIALRSALGIPEQ